jgi:hypothetical protein
VRHLAELLRTRQVTSLELTEMYLARLHRYNGKLNNVVTFLDDTAARRRSAPTPRSPPASTKGRCTGFRGARRTSSRSRASRRRGIAGVQGQSFDYDASVVEMLRDAGAVLIAKLATGELAGGDNWFGGQTKNPWDSDRARAARRPARRRHRAGCVAFGIGTETERIDPEPVGSLRLAGLRRRSAASADTA